ncbi:helix-turn-helix domain-containing protein [Acidothermaceae bacterium B102]|nr:helix-turn-helix domain-containing protein [Acidothermaceae bacterium B102]
MATSSDTCAPADGPSDALIADVFAHGCTSRQTLEDVASKWGILAMLALGEGSYRFNALRRRVDGVSEKMLSQTLQSLERDGLVTREVHSAIPPRVEYSLTPLGADVAGRLRDLADVLEGSSVQLGQARAAYDARTA